MLKTILLIGAGGFVGSVARYYLSSIMQAGFIQNKSLGEFPFGTLTVNILGCLIIGLIYGYSFRYTLTFDWRILLVTGLCGGFTTFSAFSIETITMLRSGQMFFAFSYVSICLLAGLLSTWGGIEVFKLL